ncbi:MAG: 1-acyl-sn-glycerol-3-phosphate acyltransferase [Proteobacteria bacterium]|nr:1-acyl-sn-glycerol-3-phosphate acyltransferase [Pseudomonadota bacterium]
MFRLQYTEYLYRTPDRPVSLLSKILPSLLFYLHLIGIVCRSSRVAKRGVYGDNNWVESSLDVLRRLEQAGVKIEISGIENLERQTGPVVFIGNHMSMMETMLLPGIIQPILPVTFVVKESLLAYPVFKHIMRSRNPVAVSRTNPRQDLKVVMSEGVNRLHAGISVIVFPQTTRSHTFDPEQMSSIGVKLAKKAGVPVIPVALKTDCWQNGSWIKDFGRLDLSKTAYYSFGTPMMVVGKGDEEQNKINTFIIDALKRW